MWLRDQLTALARRHLAAFCLGGALGVAIGSMGCCGQAHTGKLDALGVHIEWDVKAPVVDPYKVPSTEDVLEGTGTTTVGEADGPD